MAVVCVDGIKQRWQEVESGENKIINKINVYK